MIQIFIQVGLNTWIIQSKNPSLDDYKTAQSTSVISAIIFYFIIFLLAPWIGYIYNNSSLILLIRVQSITILFMGFISVPISKIQRDLEFLKLFKIRLISTIFQGLTGIYLAFSGFGIWSLIYSSLIYQLSSFLMITIFIGWIPINSFNIVSFKTQFKFGSHILVASLLDNLLVSLQSLIIYGKYNSAELGFYNRGLALPTLIMSNTEGTLSSVLFPIMSRLHHFEYKLKDYVRIAFSISSYIIFPMMIGLILISKSLIIFLFTDKWIGSIQYMQIYSLITITWITSIFVNSLNAIGRSDLNLKINLVIKFIAITCLLVLSRFGIISIMLGMLFYSIINAMLLSYFADKLLEYSLKEQLSDIIPTILVTFLMGLSVYLVGVLVINIYLKLILQILFGVISYLIFSILFKNKSFLFIYKNLIQKT